MSWDEVILILWKILAVLVLVLLNGFFVAAEFALVKIRDTQLTPKIRQGDRRAKTAHLILQRLDAFLSAAQLGITLASLGLGWIGEPVFSALLHPVFGWLQVDSVHLREGLSFAVGFTVITFLHISAGEQAPKWLAIQRPLPVTLWIAYPMLWFYRVSYPFVWVLNHFSQWLLRRVGIEPAMEGEGAHSEEELRLLFAGAQQQDGATGLQREIVLNALDLKRRVVRDVMRPRQEIAALNTETTIAECLELAEKTRYSRFPLCNGGNLDKTLGVVHIKDLYALRTSETTWEAAGALPLHELEELLGEPLREEGITTTSGWVTHRLGGFPKAGDTLNVGHYELRVEEMDGMRVARLSISKRLSPEIHSAAEI